MRKRPVNRDAPRELVPVKMPAWMKKMAAQVGEETGERLGEVFERLCAKSLRREHAAKVATKAGA